MQKTKPRKFKKAKFIKPIFLDRPNYKSIGYTKLRKTHLKNSNPITALKEAGCDAVFHESNEYLITPSHPTQLQAAISAMNPGDELVVSHLGQLGHKQHETLAKIYKLQEEGKYLRTLDGQINTRQIGPMTSPLLGLIAGINQLGVEQNLTRRYVRDHEQNKTKRVRGRPKISQPKEALVMRLRQEGESYRSIKDQTGLALSTIRRIIVDRASINSINVGK